jgi:hypothetical protein
MSVLTDRIAEIAQQPAIFAMGVGVANGMLAVLRDKPITPQAAAITAAVIAAGELALVYELPEDERPDLVMFTLLTILGTYAGLAGFVSWEYDQPSLYTRMGEGIVDWAYAPSTV